jgi:hypothetical protein
MSGNSAWGFEASKKMTPTKVHPNDTRIFMVRWDFGEEGTARPMQIEYSFIVGLGNWKLWEQLDEYGSPSCAEVRVVRQRDYGNIQLDGTMVDGEVRFKFRQGGEEGLRELWAACRPLEWDDEQEFKEIYGKFSKRNEQLGEVPPL